MPVHLFPSRKQELIQISKKLIHFDLREEQEGQRFFLIVAHGFVQADSRLPNVLTARCK
jgi:hypothetical protein